MEETVTSHPLPVAPAQRSSLYLLLAAYARHSIDTFDDYPPEERGVGKEAFEAVLVRLFNRLCKAVLEPKDDTPPDDLQFTLFEVCLMYMMAQLMLTEMAGDMTDEYVLRMLWMDEEEDIDEEEMAEYRQEIKEESIPVLMAFINNCNETFKDKPDWDRFRNGFDGIFEHV